MDTCAAMGIGMRMRQGKIQPNRERSDSTRQGRGRKLSNDAGDTLETFKISQKKQSPTRGAEIRKLVLGRISPWMSLLGF